MSKETQEPKRRVECGDLRSVIIRPALNGWIMEIVEAQESRTLIFLSWEGVLAALNKADVGRTSGDPA